MIKVKRGNEEKEYKIKTAEKEFFNPETKKKEKVTVVGIRPKSNSTIERYGIVAAAPKAWEQTKEFTVLTVKSIYKMILRKIQPDVAGPLGVIQISYEVAKTGLINLLFLFAIININLALVNLLPILPLDGGLAFMFVIEWIIRRKVPLKVQEALMQFGWMLLIALLIFFTYKDILRFIRGG
jgi:regulator of sigma E protease